MTFQSEFAVTKDLPIDAWELRYETGTHLEVIVDAPQWICRGAAVEVDVQDGRVRVPVTAGVYLEGEFDGYLKTNIVDLAAYAKGRIAAIMKKQDADVLAAAAQGWIKNGQVFCWTKNLPWQLELSELAAKDQFRAVQLSDQGLVIAKAADGGVKAAGIENTWVVPLTDISLDDLDFGYAPGELQDRHEVRMSRADRVLMSIDSVVSLLRTVEVLTPHLPEHHPTTIRLATTADEFAAAVPAHVTRFVISAGDLNAFTDRATDPTRILLRPGAQGVGTEVHQMLHALASPEYQKRSWFFLDEGLTEYLTRKATDGIFDRNETYSAARYFIRRLVEIGATDDKVLARLYFTGDWAGFEERLLSFAGRFVSFRALRQIRDANSLATIDYLRELHRDRTAPLGKDGSLSLAS